VAVNFGGLDAPIANGAYDHGRAKWDHQVQLQQKWEAVSGRKLVQAIKRMEDAWFAVEALIGSGTRFAGYPCNDLGSS
jgi:hypothetical protein